MGPQCWSKRTSRHRRAGGKVGKNVGVERGAGSGEQIERSGGGRSDAELAAAMAARDQAALGELYDRYGGLAYSLALRLLGDGGRAEDCVQEAFIKLWNGAARFDPARGSLRTWLVTAVRNRAIDLLRGRGGRERAEVELHPEVGSTESGPEQRAVASSDRAAVRAALADLPSEQRRTVELAYYGGYTQSEIAELMKVPLSTVKGRMRLALEKLASYLKGRGMVDG
jgi:RNA polymerase sigma-70 factor (ECF subfamily)